jgi:hypothetical protein
MNTYYSLVSNFTEENNKMALKDFDFVKDDEEKLAYLDRHLEGTEVTGSYVFREVFPTVKDLVDFAVQHIQDYNGERMEIEVDMPHIIGYDSLTSIENLSEGATVTKEPRGKNEVLANVVSDAPMQPTKKLVIVAGPMKDNKHGFYTIFPGTNAPQFPATKEQLVEFGYEGEALEKAVQQNSEFAKFWDSHGFVNEPLYESHRNELQTYEAEHGLRDLEGRLLRGLDPAGMLAIEETRELVKSKLSVASYDSLVALTNGLHVGGIWENAEKLAVADSEEVKAWMLMAYACEEVNDKDLSELSYLKDFERVKEVLFTTSFDTAVHALKDSATSLYTVEEYNGHNIPVSKHDAFLEMAMTGYTSGVVASEQESGEPTLYFVGANELDFESFANEQGLTAVEKEDRGRMSTFYQKDGQDVAKKLYKGFAIVFGDKELALDLATRKL